MLVLGIESSCDETAAALVEDGRAVHSNVVASQIETHRRFGGVVPELASREHLRNIGYVVWRAFREAGKQYSEIDGIAVTQGPGLIGSLLVGLNFAKAMAYSLKKPLVPVNHIEGHIFSAVIKPRRRPGGKIPRKVVDLVASYQQAIVDTLVRQTARATESLRPRSILLVGG